MIVALSRSAPIRRSLIEFLPLPGKVVRLYWAIVRNAAMAIDPTNEKSIGVTAFKAQCLALIDEVARGKTRRVMLTKHNRPVAAIVPVEPGRAELWGALRGTVKVAPGADLTQGVGENWEAQR
jgi:prevent-host-death family protein